MMNASAQALDIELTPHDLQALNGGEAVAGFFARLGYDIDLRTPQTPGNLGITAESTARPIKKIELLASQENLFQVYLFELTSVTVAHTRALARAFRNRAGNYLLVLTSDYENLDFVLLEKYLPSDKGNGASIAQKQVGIRPRVLTVERRKPSRIHLRVLRRFTWTESDPFAQYDKLLSAYAVADWSEEYFNNRALFSDYYLKERLPELPEWIEDPKPTYLNLRNLYQGASAKFSGLEIAPFRQALLEPLFQLLGFSVKPGKIAGTPAPNPHYRLLGADAGAPLALCLAYPWARSLDGKDDQRDKTIPEENPSARVVSLLEQGEVPWVMVTNGKLWRLYSARTHSRATNYYEIDLEEVLAGLGPGLGDPAESFRYFWLLFRRQAFETLEIEREGKKIQSTFLDRLLLESEDYAKELGERLKERVFEEIFPHLAAGFIAHIREQEGDQADLSQPRLDKIFQGTLTLLYRLLFLLYAEARLLLPVRETRGYFEISLDKIKKEVAEAAGDIADEVDGCLKKRYRHDLNEIYERLNLLFQAVDLGDAALNVPIYNGGLFISNPDPLEQSPEAQNSRFLQAYKVPDRYLALALDCMARDLDSKRHDLVFIDYKSLGVRQLGSIYEGLLEFKLRIADRKLAIVKEKSREVYKPLSELEDAQKNRVEKSGRIIKKGAVHLENDKRERKATGSYYTPDHIVKYIVANAVGPVLQERFEQLRPKLRQAQNQRREFFKRQEALLKQGLRPEPDSKADLVGRELVEEFFRVKILDPAMGSGHFLVEAVDFITDKALDFLNAFPWNPIIARLEEMRRTILKEMDDQGITIDAGRLTDVNLLKRQVLKGCIYGVDLNPMAVELAKVSLWLDCFTLGAPLSFLDHHLRCGNSLIGVTVKEVQEALQEGQMKLFGSQFAGLLLATETMRQVGELSDITSAQVRESRREYCKAVHMLAQFKRILDVYTSQWFGNTPYKRGRGKNSVVVNPVLEFLKGDESEAWLKDPTQVADLSDFGKKVAATVLFATRGKRFFHWELEFPEIFYGPRPGTLQAIELLEGAGFDAVIGNPPYDVLAEKELGFDISQELEFFENSLFYEPAIRGKKNLYKLFICRGGGLMGAQGAFSFIVPMALLGDDQAAEVRRLLLKKTGISRIEAFPQKDDPSNRVFPEAKLSTTVFATKVKPSDSHFIVRTHSGRYIEDSSSVLTVRPSEILAFDLENNTIPSCTQRDWDIVVRFINAQNILRMSSFAKSFQGEVNETNERARSALTSNVNFPLALRGANICMYAVREASQGEDVRINVKKFLSGKGKETKAYAFQDERLGFQRSAPQNNFRRIIAAFIDKGNFCLDTVSYITQESSKIDLEILLALLNSKLLDWFFRLGSTNSKVNEYQFNTLPVPTIAKQDPIPGWEDLFNQGKWPEFAELLMGDCKEPGIMSKSVADALSAMCRRIQEIESQRILKSRSERSHLAPESQPIQDAIDAVLFRCYGLTSEEAQYIDQRLKEML